MNLRNIYKKQGKNKYPYFGGGEGFFAKIFADLFDMVIVWCLLIH